MDNDLREVSFTEMKHGSKEEYEFLTPLFQEHQRQTLADEVLAMLMKLQGPKLGYKVDRYEHSLQSATRALRDGADDELVVCALLHDIGDSIAPDNHSQLAAAVLKPYVSDKNHWIIRHHGVFQGYYYFHHMGQDQNARDQFKDHEHYQACADFCENYDQNCFDPDYDTEPLATFEPMVRALFGKQPVEYV
ncbi:MAG: HD domain-containing protein [Alphaproteobacteria bacterium]|jgi:predicted HD phosphohydrolase|nr:HD domain-containing protein [Alphaproteobacteria bacterium]MBT4019254.1 HD domain-containing protein [Alphaproteobacteria bacterium]MBT4967202.1 HD domain-containing protein [Alphaproteobacteria bacterium]MBT5159940.1 HD domain-containing protein [Alphaproteobacteria bacterium]MBT5916999.1 HD domain-containing protein [Alphaproteobacteria bacterium]